MMHAISGERAHMGLLNQLRTLTAILVMLLILCAPATSHAWASGGHMMIAWIAQPRLTPNAKREVDRLLAISIEPRNLSDKSKDFVNAAHWADDIRALPQYDNLKPQHFIDQPISLDGTPLPPESKPVSKPNLVTALDENVKILWTSRDDKAKARALRLIIHFVGDIHQPLHCSTRVDGSHPEGDSGGNRFYIGVLDDSKRKKISLHSYWDNGLDTFPNLTRMLTASDKSKIRKAADQAIANNPATDLNLDQPPNFDLWAKESLDYARDAYLGLRGTGIPTASYKHAAVIVVNKRIAWAGYRLAELLNDRWP